MTREGTSDRQGSTVDRKCGLNSRRRRPGEQMEPRRLNIHQKPAGHLSTFLPVRLRVRLLVLSCILRASTRPTCRPINTAAANWNKTSTPDAVAAKPTALRLAGTHYLCSLAVNTGVILDTREHGPSRSAGAIVNDVIIIFYLQDGCPK